MPAPAGAGLLPGMVPTTCDTNRPAGAPLDAEESVALDAINGLRGGQGLAPFFTFDPLTAAARLKTALMARGGPPDHDDPGLTWEQRFTLCGYPDNLPAGEALLAGGPAGGMQAVQAWWESPIHRAILSDPQYSAIGIARAPGANGFAWVAIAGAGQNQPGGQAPVPIGQGDQNGGLAAAPPPEPKLTITKTPDIAKAAAGEVITYTITVTNSGDGEAKNVYVWDEPIVLSPLVHFDTQCPEGSEKLGVCGFPTIPPGGSVTVTVRQYFRDPQIAAGTKVENKARYGMLRPGVEPPVGFPVPNDLAATGETSATVEVVPPGTPVTHGLGSFLVVEGKRHIVRRCLVTLTLVSIDFSELETVPADWNLQITGSSIPVPVRTVHYIDENGSVQTGFSDGILIDVDGITDGENALNRVVGRAPYPVTTFPRTEPVGTYVSAHASAGQKDADGNEVGGGGGAENGDLPCPGSVTVTFDLNYGIQNGPKTPLKAVFRWDAEPVIEDE